MSTKREDDDPLGRAVGDVVSVIVERVFGAFALVSRARQRSAEKELRFGLRRVERMNRLLPKRFIESPELSEKVVQVLETLMRTTLEAKRDLLRNALVNTVVSTETEEVEALFIQSLGAVAPVHVRVLELLRRFWESALNDPALSGLDEAEPFGVDPMVLALAFEGENASSADLLSAAQTWLEAQGMIERTLPSSVPGGTRVTSGREQAVSRQVDNGFVRITPLGLRFLRFLEAPDEAAA